MAQNVQRILILDLDGTLFDSQNRFNECQKLFANDKRGFWNCFQSERFMDLDIPKENVLNFVKPLINENTITIIVSGRSVKQYNKTLEQLNKIGIIPNEIYLRGERDFRKDFEFKASIIVQILEKYNANEIIMVDDSDDVINHISQKFQNIKVVDAKKL
jgi:hydroxymethylpyrimidine pyrophosphatase-like HAD family hydrolase